MSVLNIINPSAAVAARVEAWAVVRRGMSNPALFISISNAAEALGAAPVLFMPMFWAEQLRIKNIELIIKIATARNNFFVFIFLLFSCSLSL